MLTLIVAMDKNQVIGYQNNMPWHLPKDLKFFKETTTGHTIIMGRKTFESIGKPLPNRKNIVLSRRSQADFPKDVKVINSIQKIYQWNDKQPNEELFVIGGGKIYGQIMPYADRMYITKIDKEFKGDTYFPKFSEDEWVLTNKAKGDKNNKNPYDYYFLQYDRKK